MIKLYDLVFEDIEKNNIDLGDKTQEFQKKLELMTQKDQKALIDFISKLNDREIEEFKSLINKYSSVYDLDPPKTPLEVNLAKLYTNPQGPGELLFHLEVQDSEMDVGDKTNHDLIIKKEVFEVKKVEDDGKFRLGKKGVASKFNFNQNLLKMVFFLDRVTEILPKLEDDFEDVSPRLLKALELWESIVSTKYTPREAILTGSHSDKFRDAMIKIIKAVKDEIEINTDDEFTTVKFGGINVTPKDKGIDPVSIQNIDDDSVTLNFIGKDTLKILEILNELPYAREGDFIQDLNDAAKEVLNEFPSAIIFTFNGKIAIIDKDELSEKIVFDTVSQGNVILRINKF